MSQCGKCSSALSGASEGVVCAECKGVFHPKCTHLETIENYKKLSSRKRSNWKCDACSAETSSTRSDESATILESIKDVHRDLSKQIGQVNSNVDNVKGQLEGVKETMGLMQTTLNTLVTENEERKQEYGKLEKENSALKNEVTLLGKQVRNLDQYSRIDNIEIVGIPYTAGDDVYSMLEDLANFIGVKFNRYDISTAHRLTATRTRPNPSIIVRFVSRECKTAWMQAAWESRRKLTAAVLSDRWPSTPVYINDHLTAHNKFLLGTARRLVKEKKLVSAWARNCKVFARRTADRDCPSTHLETKEDLDRLLSSDE